MRRRIGGVRGGFAVAILVSLAAGPAADRGAGGEAAAAEPVPAELMPAGATDILNMDSYWRWYLAMRKPTVAGEAGSASGAGPNAKALVPNVRGIDHLATPPPPAGWQQPDFDDSHWPRSRAAWLRELVQMRFSGATACLRGRFRVTDPAAVKGLYLTCKYYGGAVVYLNGKELARADLPEGRLAPDASARPYSPGAYVGPKGKPIPSAYHRARLAPGLKEDVKARVAGRQRTLGPLILPTDALRKGVNVLAIEVRRGDYPRLVGNRFVPDWRTLDIREARLAAVGGGVVPNVRRPGGFQVWNHDRNDRVTVLDYGDPNEELRPIRIVAARNGSFCGQVVMSCTEPVKGLRASVADLAGDGGVIAADNVTLLYGRMDWPAYHYPTWCDGLTERQPTEVPIFLIKRWMKPALREAAILPIMARVRVPADAAPGTYRGRLTLTARDVAPVNAPIELHVADWRIPDPPDYHTYVGIYQSPTSVAMQYHVEPWSEEHWRLMEKSFEFLARVGNKLALVHVVDQTQFGNDEGMIYWVKKPDGSYDYDFSVFDRYMQLVSKHLGRVDYVAVQVWHSGGWETRKPDNTCTVTVIDPKTGKREHVQVPVFGTEQSKAFWKPVLDRIRQRLARLGLAGAMTLGILSDGTAAPEVFAAFNEIIPGGARWMRGCHSQNYSPAPYRLRGGGKVVLHEYCYGLGLVDPEKPLPKFHTYRGRPGAAYHRISGHENAATLIWYRTFPEQSLFRNTRGVGRICLDFWPVVKDRRGRRSWIYNRFPHSSCAQRAPSLQKMVWPGPAGAETTVRFEAFAEGLQEAEAVLVLSEAIDRHADRLGPEWVERCRKVLVDRLRYCHTRDQMTWARVYFHMNHLGWQELSKRLFECAAEVTRRVGRPAPRTPRRGDAG